MSDPTQFAPGSFGCHEALHMASVLAEMVDERLCEHPAVQANVEWLRFAVRAQMALSDLYQAIGAAHFNDDDDGKPLTDALSNIQPQQTPLMGAITTKPTGE